MSLVTIDKATLDILIAGLAPLSGGTTATAVGSGVAAQLGAQSSFVAGIKSAISASTPVQISTNSAALKLGTTVKADPNNAASSRVFVVTGSGQGSNGFALGPGQAVPVPVNAMNKVFVKGSTSGLAASFLGA